MALSIDEEIQEILKMFSDASQEQFDRAVADEYDDFNFASLRYVKEYNNYE